jgi:Holliday junction resolvasome RuvABC endonuclease subunit
MPNPKIWGERNLKGAVAIGIDQSYTGFGITAIDKKGNYYTEVYKSEGSGIERLYNIRNYLEDFLSEYEVSGIAMEGYAFGSHMSHMLGELGGMIKLLLFDLYPGNDAARFPLVVPPPSLKKYIVGKASKVAKSQILLNVYKKWDVDFDDDNAADSYGLARIVRNKHDFEYEKEVYDKLTLPGK